MSGNLPGMPMRSASASTTSAKRFTLWAGKYLLCYTGGSAAAIAAELNFPSPAYFNRFFKRETGLTPGEFRKKNRIP